MENLIKFIEVENKSQRRKLKGNMASVWFNLDGRSNNYGTTFSQDIKTDKSRIKIGKIGEKVCVVFTNEKENSLNLYNSQNPKQNMRFDSRIFCEMFFPKLKNLKKGKDKIVLSITKMTDDIYLFEDQI